MIEQRRTRAGLTQCFSGNLAHVLSSLPASLLFLVHAPCIPSKLTVSLPIRCCSWSVLPCKQRPAGPSWRSLLSLLRFRWLLRFRRLLRFRWLLRFRVVSELAQRSCGSLAHTRIPVLE